MAPLKRSKTHILTLLMGIKESPSFLVKDKETHGRLFIIATKFGRSLYEDDAKSLGARIISPTRLFIEGNSILEAIDLTISLVEVFFDKVPKFGWFPLYEQLQFFRVAKSWPSEYFISYAKYFTAYPMAFYMENDLPEMPEGYLEFCTNPLVYTGRIHRFLRSRLLHHSQKTGEIWWSILQGVKRGAHEAPEYFIFESFLKHRKRLTTPPTNDIDPSFTNKLIIFLTGYRAKKPTFLEASTSASFDTTRSDGGQRNDVRNWILENFGYINEESKVRLKNGAEMQAFEPFLPSFNEVVDVAHEQFCGKPLKVQVHGILEPLKVRLITKGESVPYWLARCCQKDMWNYLQQFDIFTATGRPLLDDDLNDLIIKRNTFSQKYGAKFTSWVSGDYSGATDGVDIRCTALVFEQIIKRSPYSENYKDILRSVIYKQELHYPSVKIKREKPMELKTLMKRIDRSSNLKNIKRKFDVEERQVLPAIQQNGQLMGSVLSFPILCIINLVSYWISMEEYLGVEIDFRELPVLINGDDILFPSNPEHYEIWKSKIRSVGFNLSIGKNYIHKNLFTINSIMFHERHGKVVRYKFFNVGLLTGKAKVTGRTSLQAKPIWDWYAEVINGSTDKWRAHRRFIHYHKKAIDSLTMNGKQNLFIDRWYGGCGFPLDPEVAKHVTFTTYQRKRASFYNWFIEQLIRKGKDPSKYILRLVPSEDHTSYSCVDMGFHDRIRIIPKTQPLNINQDKVIKRLYNLPLLSQPHDPSKLNLVFKPGHKLPSAKKIGFQPKMALRKLLEAPFTLVAENEFPLAYQFSGFDADEARFFDPDIVEPTSRSITKPKGWYEIDFNTGHILHYDEDLFKKISKPRLVKKHLRC
jgi:hypothetical protein